MLSDPAVLSVEPATTSDDVKAPPPPSYPCKCFYQELRLFSLCRCLFIAEMEEVKSSTQNTPLSANSSRSVPKIKVTSLLQNLPFNLFSFNYYFLCRVLIGDNFASHVRCLRGLCVIVAVKTGVKRAFRVSLSGTAGRSPHLTFSLGLSLFLISSCSPSLPLPKNVFVGFLVLNPFPLSQTPLSPSLPTIHTLSF